MLKAVKRLGFATEAVDTVWQVLAAILHLGNMDFVPKVNSSSF